VRVPYVPGVNDAEAEIRQVARFAASIRGVRQVSLLPFHRWGGKSTGAPAEGGPVAEFKPLGQALGQAVEILHKAGLVARAGG